MKRMRYAYSTQMVSAGQNAVSYPLPVSGFKKTIHRTVNGMKKGFIQ